LHRAHLQPRRFAVHATHQRDTEREPDRCCSDRPAHDRRQERVGETHDEVVAQVDGPGLAQHIELKTHEGERSGQGDHERRDPEARDHEPVEEPDEPSERQRCKHAQHGRYLPLHYQDRHDRGTEPTHRPHGQVDLTQQQHEDHTDRDGRDRRLLQHEVGQVARAQEPVVLPLEERPDGGDHEEHEQRAGLALSELAAHFPNHAKEAALGARCGALGAHACAP